MQRTIGNCAFFIDLLEALLSDGQLKDTTLIVCSTKKSFLRQISPAILTPQVQEIPASQDSVDEDDSRQEAKPHRFLIPTLGLLASARPLKLIFCPSIKSLRALLSTLSGPPPTHEFEVVSRSLIIIDLVFLHSDTSECSAQGLSRTFSCAVEAAARNGMHLRLVECKDFHDSHNPNRGFRLWDMQVPLLSGSVRLGGESAAWAGRSLNIRTIASRWFSFEEERPVSCGLQEQAEDENMLV